MDKKQYITFRIADFMLGIDILMVREINRMLDITEAPQTPDYVVGLINLRGQTITVFDLGVRLGMNPSIITSESHNIIFKHETVGLLVDQIGDVITVNTDDINPPPANTGDIEAEYIEGVVELDKNLLMILSAEKILAIEDKSTPPRQ